MRNDGFDETVLVGMVGVAVAGAVVLYVAAAIPALLWCAPQGRLAVLPFADAAAGMVRWVTSGLGHDPRTVHGLVEHRDMLPPPQAWLALDAAFTIASSTMAFVAWLRIDRWRGLERLGLPAWDPRSWVATRSWARPRDLLALQPSDNRPRVLNRVLRTALHDWRSPARAGGDSWSLGTLCRRPLRSLPEMHLLTVAPTRSGKTTRVLLPALLEHCGSAVVLLNKTDVLHAAAERRAQQGPVHVFAPLTPADVLPMPATGWTPLRGCEDWEHALRMGRWIFDADPSASADSNDSGGARFYNRDATAVALPPLLQAAALAKRGMADVLTWLRGGLEALDEPREILTSHCAERGAAQIAGVQALDERPRSLLLMSAAQLVSAYRFPGVEHADRDEFDPSRLLAEGGTLFLHAPDGDQESLAPIFGALLGAILRVTEERAAATGRPTGPLLRILVDEAAHLAPLQKLPTYLSVSAGWGVRWLLVYQSISQLQHRYGREADSILGNAQCKMFLGPIQDESTRRYLVELLGEEIVTTRSRTSRGSQLDHSTTLQERREHKASAQRLMQLRLGEAVLTHGRELPAITRLPAPKQDRRR